jgi:hypothetical protein
MSAQTPARAERPRTTQRSGKWLRSSEATSVSGFLRNSEATMTSAQKANQASGPKGQAITARINHTSIIPISLSAAIIGKIDAN